MKKRWRIRMEMKKFRPRFLFFYTYGIVLVFLDDIGVSLETRAFYANLTYFGPCASLSVFLWV